MSATPPVCDFGWKALDFRLPAVEGRDLTLADVRGPQGTLVMFICNHCPYVQAILPRLIDTTAALQAMGVGVVAISSNDAVTYPQDSFTAMQGLARERQLPFAYLYDENQSVARAWGAICTPDFFGFNAADELQYRGRFDASRKEAAAPGARADLLEAMTQIVQTGQGPREQIASIGCSIKWKDA